MGVGACEFSGIRTLLLLTLSLEPPPVLRDAWSLYHGEQILTPGTETQKEAALRSRCEALPLEVFAQVDELALSQALARVMEVVGEINGYLERTAPWREAKARNRARVATILYTACEALRLVSALLQPVLPPSASDGRMGELWRRLGCSRERPWS